MSNNYFDIEGIHIEQELCAMKVGTDGVLLGRWAAQRVPQSSHVLDIGSGTGVLSLLIAKLADVSRITAIDIEEGAYEQTRQNIVGNGMADRVEARRISLQDFAAEMDARMRSGDAPQLFEYIVCNPPYFKNSLKCPDSQRNLARHNDSLSFRDLMQSSARLLAADGRIAIIMPAETKPEIDMEAAFAGLSTSQEFPIKTSEKKPVKRYIVEYCKPYK